MRNKSKEFHKRPDQCLSPDDPAYARLFPAESADERQTARKKKRELINACNELGSYYRSAGQYSESIFAFEQAKALAAVELEKNWDEYATILNNMAGTYRLMRDYQRAVVLFLEALEVYRKNGNQESYTYAGVLNNLSLTYREMRQFEKAIVYLEQALALTEKMQAHKQELAIGYNDLTVLYHAVGNEELAMRCLNRALQEYEECPEEDRIHFVPVLNSLAAFLYTEGEYERALMLYRKSAKHIKQSFGETEEYGIVFQNMRWVYEKMGLRKEATAALAKAGQVYERLLGADHERTQAITDDLQRMRENRGFYYQADEG